MRHCLLQNGVGERQNLRTKTARILSKGSMMTREELIEDIKKTIPGIVDIAGNNFDWDHVADMIEKKNHTQIQTESTNDISDEDFKIKCVYLAYANYKRMDI